MNNIIKHKTTILISLAVGIALFYIQPILTDLGSLVVDFFVFSSTKFSDNYYSSIAKNDPNLFSMTNSYILMFFFVGAFIAMLLYLTMKKWEMKNLTDDSLSDIRETKLRALGDADEPKSKEEILDEIDQLENKAVKLRERAYARDNRLIFLFITTPILAIILITNYAIDVSINNENVSFKNNTLILLPHIGQSEVDSLNASWASMKNSSDYRKIDRKVSTLLKKHIDKN